MAKRKRRLPPRGAHGQFVKKGYAKRARTARRTAKKRVARRVYKAKHATYRKARRGVVLLNPRRRRYHRRYRRNPSLGSLFSGPMIKTVAYAAGGMIGTPMVEGFINGMLPASLQGNVFSKYGVKIGAAFGLGFAADKLLGREAGRAVYIGAGIYVGMSLLKEFAPTLLPAGTGSYMRAQPMIGRYAGSYMTSTAPERLRPETRF